MKKIFTYLTMTVLALGSAMHADAQSWSKYRIMLDPGHGGTDSGATGPSAPHEATLALRCAKTLNTKITGLGGTVKLTRTTDTYISLSARKSACASYDPYIFCSIHLNAANTSAHGTETWYYWSTGNSKPLANKVQATLISEMGRSNRGVKQNGWTVITASSSIPAILTEGLFVDNPTEWGLIKTEGSTGYNNWVNGHLFGFYDHLNKNLGASITNPRSSSTTPTPTTNPTIKVDASSWTFNCDNGASDSYDFTVTGTDLSAKITISSNKAVFALDKTSLAKTGGTFKVTFTPTAVGNVTGTITLTSGSVTKTIALTGKATAPTLKFTTKWRACDERSNAQRWGWDALAVRNMDYNQGKLYLVYNHSDIKVVNAQTGAELGNLNKGAISGGVLTLCDVKVVENKVIASNIGNSADKPLKVYIWDNDQAQPRVMLETSDFGGAARLGDYICYKGTLASGKLIFVNDDGSTTRLVKYTVTNGVANPTPAVTKVTTDGTTQLKTSASARAVYANVNGVNGFWIDGKDNHTAFVNTSGVRQFYIDQDETWGNAISTFTWQGTEYAVTTVYNPMEGESWSSQTAEQKAKNYTGGRMRLLRNDDTWSKATACGDYPSAGLSKTRQNTNCTSNVITSVNGNVVEAWVLSSNQGIGYYISEGSTAPSYEVDPVVPAEPAMSIGTSSINLSTTVGTPVSEEIALTASDLAADVTVAVTGADASMFTVSPSTLAQSTTSAKVTVTYNPSAAGSHSANIVFTSGSLTATVAVTGSAAEQPVLGDNTEIDTLTKVWSYSATEGNAGSASWLSLASPESRDMCFNDGKLYVLNAHAWNATPSIAILDAYTGATSGSLSTSGISGGESIIASIKSLGGTIIACNGARATDALKIYKWNSDSAAPEVWLDAANHGGIHCGEIMSVSGDMQNGKIMFSDGTCIVVYTVTGGTVNATPTVVNLTKNGEAWSIESNKSSNSVTLCDDGSYWLTAKGSNPVHVSATGEYIETISATAMATDKFGSAAQFFTFGGRKYMAATGYLDLAADVTSLADGTMTLVDLTDGVDAATNKGVYPAQGLGSTRNTTFQTAICYELANNDTRINLWTLVTMQGIAMYSFDGGVAPVAVKGDVNGDNAADMSDVAALINIITGIASAGNGADVNNDGTVDISDVASLINIITGK